MTPKQKKTLDAIRLLSDEEVSPSYRQLAAHLGFGLGQVHRHVSYLVQEGFVVHVEGRYRTIRVVDRFKPEHLESFSHGELLSLRNAIDKRLSA